MNILRELIRPIARPLFQKLGLKRDIQIAPFGELFPDVECTYVIRPQTVETPHLATKDLAPGLAQHRAARYTTPGMFAAVLHNVLFCPTNHVILTHAHEVLEESLCTIPEPQYLDQHALSTRNRVRIKEPSATFRSRWYNNHYHTLVDHLPRLYGLIQYSGKDALPNLLVGDTLTSVEEFVIDRIDLSGTFLNELGGGALYELDTCVFISGMCRRDMSYLSNEYITWFRDQVFPKRPSAADRRILISRSNASSRRMINEEEVSQRLSERGFELFYLEELSPRDQVELFYDAEAVVSMHGAGLANLVYSPHARVVECFSSWHFVPNYYLMAESLDLSYRKVHSNAGWREDNTDISVDAILNALNDMGIS